ncbi:MbtH family NRPS accessory protein [Nocardiopsis sp. NRRL B-16309]|uniref:MbtH family protein n=1 Tax=Nocardiopsis sp. NRRL B-16309 TaxID=1519494 RepID=UPI0006AFA0FB|nr:MbtH family NRPS accessory protein [Nocardiopsis sp. NRRL B-16309]KOX08885.1 antibiotic synthesis protein MbtH [Nocardiopsis sp. NRRL B-16309]
MSENEMKVLVNDEEQYSLWPSYLDVPAGWEDTGVSGSREDCLAYVKEVWTDMRPRSLREQMAGAAGRPSGE